MKVDTFSTDQIKAYYKIIGGLSKVALERKFHNGECLGCAPVGYTNVTVGNKKCVVKDEFKAPIIQVAFRLAGEGNMSLRAILQRVTYLGLTSRNGKTLGTSALRGILTNPFYMGKIRHNGLLRSGKHEVIIDERLFLNVQDNLAKRSKIKTCTESFSRY